jgi:hypothetical protein
MTSSWAHNPYRSPEATTGTDGRRQFSQFLLVAILLGMILIGLIWTWWLLSIPPPLPVDAISGAT